MKKLIASVNPRVLKALLITSARVDVRFYLCGIALQQDKDGNTRFAGCDGNRLSVFGDIHMQVETEIIIPNELIKLAIAAFKGADLVDISVQDDYVIISSTFNTQQVYDKFIDGKYPDINRVIPSNFDERSKNLAAFNIKYIADAINVGKAVSASSTPIMQTRDKNVSAVITYIGVPDLTCIIMPMRDIAGFFAEDGEWKPS